MYSNPSLSHVSPLYHCFTFQSDCNLGKQYSTAIVPLDADKPGNKGQKYTASIKESSLLLDYLATGSILESTE